MLEVPLLRPSNRVSRFVPRGAVLRLWEEDFHPRETLIQGPRGTGKSRGVCQFIFDCLSQFPGMRVLAVRKTRVSMNETFLKTWEQDTLPPSWKSEIDRITRGHREKYVFKHDDGPDSELIVAGMDQERLIGADLDLVVGDETYQLSLKQWVSLLPLLRNKRFPHPMAIALTNPAGSKHWLNRRAEEGTMVRLRSVHDDNPSLDGEEGRAYKQSLASLPEPYRTRWFVGDWVSAEGLVYPEWNEKLHVVKQPPPMKGHFGAMDFGWEPSPGVFQVWGVDHSDRLWLLVEHYQRKVHIDKWAAQIERLHEEFEFRAIVADSAEPRTIDFLNQHLSSRFGRSVGEIVEKADKSWDAGRQAVLFAMSPSSGGPRLFVREGYERKFPGVGDEMYDPKYDGLPTCFTDEIENYVMQMERSDGTPGGDKPEKNQANHSMDTLRYACCWARDNVFTARTSKSVARMGFEDQELYKLLGPKAFWEYVAGVPGAKAVPWSQSRRLKSDMEN